MKVSVIIVHYKAMRYLPDCLDALRAQSFRDFETILVDNASGDGAVEYVRRNHPEVRLFPLASNRGFTGGNIEGLRHARGEYVALLNPDTVADPKWLAELIRPMERDERVGICASRLVIHGTGAIDSAGDGMATSGLGFKRGFEQPAGDYAESGPVFGACGGAALYRRRMIDEIGFFDDDFFLVHEDTDLNFRALLAGWRCVYVAEAVVLHRVSGTIGLRSPLAVRQFSRNTEWVYLKNMPLSLMLRYLHHKILVDLYTLIDSLRDGRIGSLLMGKIQALAGAPRMLKKRREVQRLRTISVREIDRMLTPVFSKELIRRGLKRFGWG
jgi:GT2 family glycosyltransferase